MRRYPSLAQARKQGPDDFLIDAILLSAAFPVHESLADAGRDFVQATIQNGRFPIPEKNGF